MVIVPFLKASLSYKRKFVSQELEYFAYFYIMNGFGNQMGNSFLEIILLIHNIKSQCINLQPTGNLFSLWIIFSLNSLREKRIHCNSSFYNTLIVILHCNSYFKLYFAYLKYIVILHFTILQYFHTCNQYKHLRNNRVQSNSLKNLCSYIRYSYIK